MLLRMLLLSLIRERLNAAANAASQPDPRVTNATPCINHDD
jgi:hypothetical protein